MIPLLIILNFIIVSRLHFYIKHSDPSNDSVELALEKKKKAKRPVIEFEGKKYQFPIWSIILLAVGAPLLAFYFYLFFDSAPNYWLHEIVVKQTAFFMQLLGIDVEVSQGFGIYPWSFNFATVNDISFETFCTGVQAIAVFVGIIVFTPHSKDKRTKEDIIWRKTKSLIVSSIIFYIVNIIRMLIQLGLFSTGQYNWEDIHYSISAASSFIAAIIILLLHKWIPEFILSIIYVGTLISEPIKAKNKEKLLEEIDKLHKVSFSTIKKSLRVKDKNFNLKFPEVAKKFDLDVEGYYILVPSEKKDLFLDALNKKFKKTEINTKK